MRKRQPLADALALSSRISLVEFAIMSKRLAMKDADEIDSIAAHVRDLERNKIIVVPQILQRVKALVNTARGLRAFASAQKKADP